MSSHFQDMNPSKIAENILPILHKTVYYMSSKLWVNIGIDAKNFPSMENQTNSKTSGKSSSDVVSQKTK